MIYGYARVSTNEQTLDLQLDALRKYDCDDFYSEKVSGSSSKRPELDKLLSIIEEGDTLVVWRLDRLGRSLKNLVDIISNLNIRKIKFKSINDGFIDTTSANGMLIYNIFASLAEFEKQLMRERTMAGLLSAKAKGRLGGRPSMNKNNHKVQAVKKLHGDKSMTIEQICKTFKISKATFYRYLKY